MRTPRNTLAGTRAEEQIQRKFWRNYISARLLGGDETRFGSAQEVFQLPLLNRLRSVLQEDALQVPVLFTERLSNRVLAVCLQLQRQTCVIAINARFKIDPEVVAHTLIEEFVHVQQVLNGVDFQAQRQQYAYHDRPYEKEAKQTAINVLGYELENYTAILLREEPAGNLLDQVIVSEGG